MKMDTAGRARIVKEMLANPVELYARLHTGFTMSYSEVASLRRFLQDKAARLRIEADSIDVALQSTSKTADWYEMMSAEAEEARHQTE